MTTDMAQFFGGGGISAATGTAGQTGESSHVYMYRPDLEEHNLRRVTVFLPQNTTTNCLSITASGYLNCFSVTNICGSTISDLEAHIVVDGTEVLDINFNNVADDRGCILWPPYIEDIDHTQLLMMGGFPIRFETSLVLRARSDRSGTNTIYAHFQYILD